MKVLFVASNSEEGAEPLELTREITGLQRRFAEAAGEPVSFVFLPDIHAESLPSELAKHRPDILHVSAHGSRERLSLLDSEGGEVDLDADMLKAFFPADRVPRLVYVNACDSGEIAEALSEVVPMAIGSTAPISNMAACSGAVAFYERLLTGATVQQSYEVARQVTRLKSRSQTDMGMWCRAGIDPVNEVLHRAPRLVAEFVGGVPKRQRDFFEVMFGMIGCPMNTVQVIFFSDDEDFISSDEDSEDDLASDLCVVVRGTPVNGHVWVGEDEAWEVLGDFRLFAAGVTADGSTFSLGSTLCEAIEHRYMIAPDRNVPDDIATALVQLRRANGANVDYAEGRRALMAQSADPERAKASAATHPGRPRSRRSSSDPGSRTR